MTSHNLKLWWKRSSMKSNRLNGWKWRKRICWKCLRSVNWLYIVCILCLWPQAVKLSLFCLADYCGVVLCIGVDPWLDRGTFPPTFWNRGMSCVLSPLLFQGRHFCTNAHSIHSMIGAIFIKFSQLILMKIIKIVATRYQILRLKCTKFNFGWGFAPDPARWAYSAPQTP